MQSTQTLAQGVARLTGVTGPDLPDLSDLIDLPDPRDPPHLWNAILGNPR